MPEMFTGSCSRHSAKLSARSAPIRSLTHPRARETFRDQPISNINTIDLNFHKRSSVFVQLAIWEYSDMPLGKSFIDHAR